MRLEKSSFFNRLLWVSSMSGNGAGKGNLKGLFKIRAALLVWSRWKSTRVIVFLDPRKVSSESHNRNPPSPLTSGDCPKNSLFLPPMSTISRRHFACPHIQITRNVLHLSERIIRVELRRRGQLNFDKANTRNLLTF